VARLIRDMGTVIAAIIICCLIGVLGVALGPIRRWAVAQVRGYVMLLALVSLLLTNGSFGS
jgi:hypothetical protein